MCNHRGSISLPCAIFASEALLPSSVYSFCALAWLSPVQLRRSPPAHDCLLLLLSYTGSMTSLPTGWARMNGEPRQPLTLSQLVASPRARGRSGGPRTCRQLGHHSLKKGPLASLLWVPIRTPQEPHMSLRDIDGDVRRLLELDRPAWNAYEVPGIRAFTPSQPQKNVLRTVCDSWGASLLTLARAVPEQVLVELHKWLRTKRETFEKALRNKQALHFDVLVLEIVSAPPTF